MIRALPRPLDWRIPIFGLLLGLNAYFVIHAFGRLLFGVPFDFDVLHEASRLSNPYEQPWYVWSPLAVYPLQLVTSLGFPVWVALHLLALIPLGKLGLIALASWPFWYDVASGNALTFVAVTAVLAYRGNRWAVAGFFVLAALIPRPLMLPLLAWLLWKEPWSRWVLGAIIVVLGAGTLATGLASEWLDRLLHLPGVMVNDVNLAPSRWIGWAWWPAGLVLAGFAFWRGWIGAASVLMQPYVFPPYLLMLLIPPSPSADTGRGWPRTASPGR